MSVVASPRPLPAAASTLASAAARPRRLAAHRQRFAAAGAALRGAVAALLLVVGSQSASAQAYPSRPIRLVVPFPAGGFADLYGRALGAKMAETFGQPVVVENRPGAGGNIASDLVAKSAPDGHTLVMGTIGTHAINATLFPKLPYDPIRDFVPIARVVDADGLLVVNPSLAVRDLPSLIALARAKPDGLTYASAGMGTTSHLAAEVFRHETKTAMTHVAYKGNVPALQDVVGGHAQLMFASLATVLPHVKAGRLVPIAVLGAQRSTALPEVPTIAEAGVPGFDVGNWAGLFAPAGTPAAIVDQLNAEVRRIMALPELRQRMQDEGMQSAPLAPSQFGDFVRAEAARWGEVVRRLGVTAE